MEDAQIVESLSKDDHFHCKTSDCDLEVVYDREKHRGKGKETVSGSWHYHCKTHNVNVCRCGWEIGWHYGTRSEEIKYDPKQRQKPTYRKHIVLEETKEAIRADMNRLSGKELCQKYKVSMHTVSNATKGLKKKYITKNYPTLKT